MLEMYMFGIMWTFQLEMKGPTVCVDTVSLSIQNNLKLFVQSVSLTLFIILLIMIPIGDPNLNILIILQSLWLVIHAS